MKEVGRFRAERIQLQDGRNGIFIETNTPINQASLTITYRGKRMTRPLETARTKKLIKVTKLGSTLIKRMQDVKRMKATGNYSSSDFDSLVDAL